ncbi:sugar ABC transporter ATP-binding protein [Nocardia mexicana]|uniref:Ribose transport system ATP-binding protein/D-xylose transport system ATP-binding protein n=1 Tax=Nocardia mexicana TaxID=279262 RepID=A0A370GNJ7_9NOCA|nr:sugar ABC transporter ATP-binding protein [Nocardia mexicana]RDI43513.1 ribose transport system ATP-binding protein/D-xylose transport system ATP-binding protein [Nocardia mexicana]
MTGTETEERPVLLTMGGIVKEFPGVRALRGVELSLNSGEVLALLGENGAGKSTLMNVLAGVHLPDAGRIEIDGSPVHLRSPKDAARHGVAMIHQELNLVPELSIADNIFLGQELRTARGTLDRRTMDARTRELLARIGLRLPPRRLVRQCRLAEQQLIEVAKALNHRLRVLVMDEPTSALAEAETQRLFAVIRTLTGQGVGVVYISHRIEELEQIADTVVVLRDGAHVGARPMRSTGRAELIGLMVGRPLDELFPRRAEQHAGGRPRLQVEGLSTTPARDSDTVALQDISFDVAEGEIVGLAGLMGAGRSEVLEALYGAAVGVGGTIRVNGVRYRPRTPRHAISRGFALVAEDRKAQSLVLGNTVRFNASLAALRRYLRPWRTVDARRERAEVGAQLAELRVRAASATVAVSTLSGGNQQKVVLAKCLLTKPSVLLMDEPTRGIDVGAKAEVHALMDQLARRGAAILAVSSELPELIGMCDRILVLCEGRVTGEFHRDPARGAPFDQEAILAAAMARAPATRPPNGTATQDLR